MLSSGNGHSTEMFKSWHSYEPLVKWKVASTGRPVRRLLPEMSIQTKARLGLKGISRVEATEFGK